MKERLKMYCIVYELVLIVLYILYFFVFWCITA